MSDIREHIDVQIEFLFQSVAEDYGLESGDITPSQHQALEEIKEKLNSLLEEYADQNAEKLCRNGKPESECNCC